MKLATLRRNGSEQAALVLPEGLLPLEVLNQRLHRHWRTDLLALIASGELAELNAWYRASGRDQCSALRAYLLAPHAVTFAPLYRRPRKLWGIGLNYVAHAADLAE